MTAATPLSTIKYAKNQVGLLTMIFLVEWILVVLIASKLTDGSYPKLFIWNGSACSTTTFVGGQ